MAFVPNAGFTGVVKRLVFESTEGATSRVFQYMELGSGAGRADTDTTATTLMTACTSSGLTRATLATAIATDSEGRYFASSTASVAGDTGLWKHTWTCGTDTPAASIKECAIFNSNTTGDMLAYGTFPAGIPMGPGDTLAVTWSIQCKSG